MRSSTVSRRRLQWSNDRPLLIRKMEGSSIRAANRVTPRSWSEAMRWMPRKATETAMPSRNEGQRSCARTAHFLLGLLHGR